MIAWTDHAIDRAIERFGCPFELRVPVRGIHTAATLVSSGSNFYVHRDQVTYVVQKLSGNANLIVTVYRQGRRDGYGNQIAQG